MVRLFVNKYPEYKVINLDKLTYAGNLDNLKDIEDKPNYKFVKMDICDFDGVLKLMQDEKVDGIIHLAAESHVDRSIKDPFTFAQTNAYLPDGKLSRRVWARGVEAFYSYDGWGNLTNTVYSDETPRICISYDALGRQIEANDAAGTTTFAYDDFGANTNETVIGVAGTNTIERHWDEFGRTAGYALNGLRQTTIAYDPATARIASMLANGSTNAFEWAYIAGSDLKSQLLSAWNSSLLPQLGHFTS